MFGSSNPNSKNKDEGAKKPTERQRREAANQLYSQIKATTTAQYTHHLATLNSKGVFNEDVNRLRAETMLQVALDRNFKSALSDATHGARPSSIPPPRTPSPAVSTTQRRGGHRRGRGHHGDAHGDHLGASATQAPVEAKTVTLARRLSELGALVQKGEDLAHRNASQLNATSALAAAQAALQRDEALSSATQHDDDGGRSPVPDADSPNLHTDGENGTPSVGADGGHNFSSIASYLQVSYQHGDYHDIAKEERALAKHRDEEHRSQKPVERYATPWLANDSNAKQWETGAAKLTAEEMTTRNAVPGRPPSSTSAARAPSPSRGTRSEEHVARVVSGDVQRQSRLRHRLEVGRHLAAQSELIHPRLRFSSQLGGGVPEETANVESSDEDDDHFATLVSKPPTTAETAEATRGCELLECTIVCISSLALKSTTAAKQRGTDGGAAPIERDRAILRNILLHCLSTLKPFLRRMAYLNSADTSHDPTNLPAFAYRLLRSWTKGVEVLLSADLDLPRGMPFSIMNPEHIDTMIRYYCLCQRGADQHANALMAQWRRNADRAIGVSRVMGQGTNLDSINTSMTANGTSAEASQVLAALRSYAGVPMGELTRMDVAEANLRFRQKELAAAFLARFNPYLPAASDGGAGGAFMARDDDDDATPAPSPATLARSKSEVISPLTSPRGAAAASRLRAMLLRYTGIDPTAATRAGSSLSETSPVSQGSFGGSSDQLIVNAMTSHSMESFLNVFKSTWGRTPLTNTGVDASEKRLRAQAMEQGLIAQLLRQYWELLGEAQHGQMLKRVELEVQRIADIDARQAAQDVAFRRATGVVPKEVEEQRQRDADGAAAVAVVTKQHLVDKYSKVENNEAQLARIRKAIERTDEWIGHEADKRALKAEGIFDTASPGHHPGGVDGGTRSPTAGAAALDDETIKATSKLEALRLRRLRELELAWQELSVSYVQRLALHDKWNAADLKSVDKAARLYTDCVINVKQREASVESIIMNESNTDERTRAIKRHELFTEMCSAGQRCEVAAKRLRAEVGDTLYYRDFVYTDKMKDDFTMVSRLLKAPTAAAGARGKR